MIKYDSLQEYEATMRQQYQGMQGKTIESNPAALTILRLMVTILGEYLREAKKSGRAQALRAGPEGEAGIICYATGELRFFDESLVRAAQQEMTNEEKDRFREMEPLDENDVLDMHEFLRDRSGDLVEEEE